MKEKISRSELFWWGYFVGVLVVGLSVLVVELLIRLAPLIAN